jgi:phosphinothricin acetyltransferase
VQIRHVDSSRDAAACAAIYAPYVIDGIASLEEVAPSDSEMARRIERTSAAYPWLVAELDGTVVGYAYGSQHHARASYRWSVDTSVYINEEHHRRGIGRALYGALLPLLVRQGFYTACAGVSLPNEGSVGLHESFGFAPVGVYRNVGYKHGSWWGVGWWQLALREPEAGEVPAEPGPPARLQG